MLVNCYNEDIEEIRTKTSSFRTTKRKRKNTKENVADEQIQFISKQLDKIVHALEPFTKDKTSHLYGEMMPIKVKGFDDDFLYNVFDYLANHESETKIFLATSTKYKKN
ncbi:hypothetical protein V6Z12_A02G079600 [Gossypium hirsutum]